MIDQSDDDYEYLVIENTELEDELTDLKAKYQKAVEALKLIKKDTANKDSTMGPNSFYIAEDALAELGEKE